VIELGLLLALLIGGFLGFLVTQSFVSQRHWRRVIAEGDLEALHASVLEAFEDWRRLRPPPDVVPSDWRALQSAALVAADAERCRVSMLAEPDIRVVDGVRVEAGPAANVARRAAVRMAERLLYDVPLARFEAVQVDVYAEYRSPDGHVDTECLLTTQVTRSDGSITDWDDSAAFAILDAWATREPAEGVALDPEDGALIAVADAPPATAVASNGATPDEDPRP
jgi:hypothetical protein